MFIGFSLASLPPSSPPPPIVGGKCRQIPSHPPDAIKRTPTSNAEGCVSQGPDARAQGLPMRSSAHATPSAFSASCQLHVDDGQRLLQNQFDS
eukprot:9491563-Pyramimonas_sp.AAC.1